MGKGLFTNRDIAGLAEKNPRYSREAYMLVGEAVAFAAGRLDKPRHVSAAELVDALLDYCTSEYGPMAPEVLHQWGVDSPVDVGTLVYELIGCGLLGASEDDDPQDFCAVRKWFSPQTAAPLPPPGLMPKID